MINSMVCRASTTLLGVMRRSAATGIARMALAATAAGLSPAAVANAQVLPPIQIVLNGFCPGTPDHFSCDFDMPSAKYHEDGTALLAPSPSLMVNASIDFGPDNFGIAPLGRVTYSFAVMGPAGPPVPILVKASGSVVASGSANFAFAAWRIAGGTIQAACVPLGALGCGTTTAPSFGGTTPLSAYPGVVNTIDLLVDIGVSTPSGSASAFVDPFIQIDPSFANASQYQLAFSDGVENVPEPSALWSSSCTLLGLAALRGTRANARKEPLGGIKVDRAGRAGVRQGDTWSYRAPRWRETAPKS